MSSLPKAIEGLTDVGAKFGDLKFVMSRLVPGHRAEQGPLTAEDRLRRAFVIQAGLGFDAREIRYLLDHRKDRLASHLKTLVERDLPWLEDLENEWPGIITVIQGKDQELFEQLVSMDIQSSLQKERALIAELADDLRGVLDGSGTADDKTKQACDLLVSLSSRLFPLFSRAKDAVGIKKAHGAI